MTASVAVSFLDDQTTRSWDVTREGSLDWYLCGVGPATALGYDRGILAHLLNRKKNVEPRLYRGLSIRTNSSVTAITQTVQRTLTAEAADDNCGIGYSSASKSGYFQASGTAVYGTGYRMVLKAPSDRMLRLKMYSTDFRGNTQVDARVMDGETTEDSDVLAHTGVNGDTMHEWQIDFQGGTTRSLLICEFTLPSAFTAADQNWGIQGFTLAEL